MNICKQKQTDRETNTDMYDSYNMRNFIYA